MKRASDREGDNLLSRGHMDLDKIPLLMLTPHFGLCDGIRRGCLLLAQSLERIHIE